LGHEKEIRTQSVYRTSAVLPCEHVGRGLRVKQPRSPEPPDEPLSHSRGEGVEVAWGGGPCREEGDGADAGQLIGGPVRCRRHARGLAHEPIHLAHEDPRQGPRKPEAENAATEVATKKSLPRGPRRAVPRGSARKATANREARLPPHDAADADHGKPWLCHRSAKWPKAMDGFGHGQSERRLLRAAAGVLLRPPVRRRGPRRTGRNCRGCG